MRRTAAAIAAATALTALAACGGSGGGDDRSPAEVLADSAAATRDAGTARTRVEQTTQVEGQEITSVVEGVGDFDSGDTQGTITVAAPGQPEQEAEIISQGTTAYIEASAFLGLGVDAQWVKIDYQAVGEQMGFDFNAFRQTGTQQLAFLSEAVDAEEVGTETTGGVETTRYSFTIDLEELAQSGPEEIRLSIRSLIEVTGIEELPAEAWIDQDDLLRRVTTTYAAEGQPTSAESTIEYSDFGVEVDVMSPREEDTIDITELGSRSPREG